jgi:hypothetical protein
MEPSAGMGCAKTVPCDALPPTVAAFGESPARARAAEALRC